MPSAPLGVTAWSSGKKEGFFLGIRAKRHEISGNQLLCPDCIGGIQARIPVGATRRRP